VNIEDESNIDKVRLTAMIILVIATFVGFMLTGIYDFELYQVALVAGIISLVIVMTSSPKDAVYVAKRVDWHILLFFIGLFVLIGGAFDSGLITDFTKDLGLFSEGTPDPLGLSVFTVILSNLVSNVPAVMLTAQMFVSADTMTWIVLAASSTLAGNMTLLGSAANIIVAERSERYGIRVDFARHMLIGTMITVATVAVMLLCVAILF
jgi:Na+/H+ antiporter NhaD/arsenite permease-like protein